MTIVTHARPLVMGVYSELNPRTYAVVDATNEQPLGWNQFPSAKGLARAVAGAG